MDGPVWTCAPGRVHCTYSRVTATAVDSIRRKLYSYYTPGKWHVAIVLRKPCGTDLKSGIIEWPDGENENYTGRVHNENKSLSWGYFGIYLHKHGLRTLHNWRKLNTAKHVFFLGRRLESIQMRKKTFFLRVSWNPI